MENTLAPFLADITIGPEQQYKNMVVFAFLTDQEATVEFITLDEALAQRALIITEINESGRVSEWGIKIILVLLGF
jgi:hypothetical protein